MREHLNNSSLFRPSVFGKDRTVRRTRIDCLGLSSLE